MTRQRYSPSPVSQVRRAGQCVLAGIRPASLRTRIRQRAAAAKEMVQREDRVGDLELSVFVRVGSIEAGGYRAAAKEGVEGVDRIGEINLAVGVRVPPAEAPACRRVRGDLGEVNSTIVVAEGDITAITCLLNRPAPLPAENPGPKFRALVVDLEQ